MDTQRPYRKRRQYLTPTAWELKQKNWRLGLNDDISIFNPKQPSVCGNGNILEVFKISAYVNDTETGFFRAIQNFQK